MAKIISGHHLVGTTKNHVTATSEKSSSGHHLKPWCGHHVWRGDFAFVLLPVGFRIRILPISEIRFLVARAFDEGPRSRFKRKGAARVSKRWRTQDVQSKTAPETNPKN